MNKYFDRHRQPAALLRSALTVASSVLAITVASGCSILGNPAPDASRYFVLSSTDSATVATPARTRSDVYFGLGPIKLPGYLESQNLVRTDNNGSVEYYPSAFWAENLRNGFARALLYRTGARIGTTHSVAYPWYKTTRVDWKVPVDVLRFEATTNERVILIVRWSVERTSDGVTVAGAESIFEEPTLSDPSSVVDGLNRCVDRLAEAIAAAIPATPPE